MQSGVQWFLLVAVATPYELGSLDQPLLSVYLRGVAFLMQRRGTEAGTEFQKVVDHSGVVGNGLIGALAHLELARAYVLADIAKAKDAYADFLTIWRHADPDIPTLSQRGRDRNATTPANVCSLAPPGLASICSVPGTSLALVPGFRHRTGGRKRREVRSPLRGFKRVRRRRFGRGGKVRP